MNLPPHEEIPDFSHADRDRAVAALADRVRALEEINELLLEILKPRLGAPSIAALRAKLGMK